MIKIKNIQNIYFIGIGGIGMSALARYFKAKGCMVYGYDKTPTPLTLLLQNDGISIQYNEDVTTIPTTIDVVVYTPAIPANNQVLLYYQTHQYTVVKRSDMLQWITENSFNICIAGTHGKTTVTTMIAHILRDSGYGCNAFLGGIAANYNTNFWSNENKVVVVEADEYDRSFLKLSPNIAVITSMDSDHLDIYGTPNEVENAFIQFSTKIKSNGLLVSKYALSRESELNAHKHITYSNQNSNATVYANNIKVVEGSYLFDVTATTWQISNITLHMGGLHNIENVTAAITVAKQLNIPDEKIKNAVANFKGVKRRFEYIVKQENAVLIDDYAHHPAELSALINGVKSIYTHKKITIVFQPHLYSRTNDLATEFAQSLDKADEVILLPIYPARELPMKGVESNIIFDKMTLQKKYLLNKNELQLWIANNKPSLVVMAGAGDIDALVQPIAKTMNEYN